MAIDNCKAVEQCVLITTSLKLLPQMVKPIANPVHLCPDVHGLTSLNNVRSPFNKKCLFFFKSSKELTLVVRSGKDVNSGYPKW